MSETFCLSQTNCLRRSYTVAPCVNINILSTNIRMSERRREAAIEAVAALQVSFAEVKLLKAEVERVESMLERAQFTGQGVEAAVAAKAAANASLQGALEKLLKDTAEAERLVNLAKNARGNGAQSRSVADTRALLQQLLYEILREEEVPPGGAAAAAAPPAAAAAASPPAAAAPPASLLAAPAPPAGAAPLDDSVATAARALEAAARLPPGKQEGFLTRITEYTLEVVAPTAVAMAGFRNPMLLGAAVYVLVVGLFVVNVVTSFRSNKKRKGGASTLKKSLSINLLKSKDISSEKKQIAGRVFNTLLKEAELKYPGVISFSKKMDPELFNLEVNKLSKILTKNEIISFASHIFGSEIIQRIIKLVNSGKSIRINTIRNRKNMYKENNYYPSASIAI